MKDNKEANDSAHNKERDSSTLSLGDAKFWNANSILESFRAEGSVKTSELAKVFSVSEMTIRRDLDELVRLGLARRVHGGVFC